MTLSMLHHDPEDEAPASVNPAEYRYDLRLEIGAKETGVNVPVVAIFHGLIDRMKQATDNDAPIVILTATDKPFSEHREMTPEEFQKAFQVSSVDGNSPKVLLGFKLRTTIKLSEIKSRIMHTYLVPHSLFLREHVGGFNDGVATYKYGFLKQDHPDHPDILALTKRFDRLVKDAWKTLDKEDRKKWREDHPNIFSSNYGAQLPIYFSKERVTASVEGKEKLVTTALMVSTPMKYGKVTKTLLDIVVMTKKVTNLIPFALSRENPNGYYNIMSAQETFIETHRNIPISNVPVNATDLLGMHGQDLLSLLNSNTKIYRVTYDSTNKKIHVSTRSDKYREVHQWIAQALREHQFPYGPSIRPMKYGTSTGGTQTNYSSVFQQAMTDPIDDASTIKTARSNAWKNRPPLAISYTATDIAFPPLPTAKPVTPATPSTTSETFDEETFQSAISTALKKMEDQHRQELAQLKLEMQQQIKAVEAQMQDLGKQVAIQTYQALVKEESPLVTKTDHAVLQQEISTISIQLNTLINLFKNGSTLKVVNESPAARDLKRTKLNLTPMKPINLDEMFTQESPISSATSNLLEEGMEGCEE